MKNVFNLSLMHLFILAVVFIVLYEFIELKEANVALAQPGTGTIRVDGALGTDSIDCGSAATPCKTIQHAVDIANSGDTIKIARGTYTDTDSEVVDIRYLIKTLTIIGGYSTTDWITPNPTLNPTIIDGENSRRVIVIIGATGGGTVINIRGVTIQNGYLTQSPNDPLIGGAGILCQNDAVVSVSNVVIANNKIQGPNGNITAVAGGGAGIFRCSITLDNVTFDGNEIQGGDATPRGAQALGGGIVATESTVVAINLTLTNNRSVAGSGGLGYLDNDFNRADALGGGAAFLLSDVTINGLTAKKNQAIAGSGSNFGGFCDGGAIYLEGTAATITDGVFMENSVAGGAASGGEGGAGEGAALMAINKSGNDSQLGLERLAMVNNVTRGGNGSVGGNANGGAMTLIGSQVVANNLIVSNNRAEAGTGTERWGGGGAIYISRQTMLNLNHATIVNNSVLSTMLGPAIVSVDDASASINYSIVADHIGSGNADGAIIALSNDIITLNYTLFSGNTLDIDSNGSGTINNFNPLTGDPAFVNPGSPDFDYHILSSSVAIDQAIGSATTDDIDSQSRPVGSAADIGADEYRPPSADLSSSTLTSIPIVLDPVNGPDHTVSYTITLKNTGNRDVTNGSVTNTLPIPAVPVTLSYRSGPTCSSGTTCSYNAANGAVTWAGIITAGGQIIITYDVTVSLPTDFARSLTIPNSAAISYDETATTTGNTTVTSILYVLSEKLYLPTVFK